MSSEPRGAHFMEIWIKIKHFSFKKIYLKSSAKWRQFCPGIDMLNVDGLIKERRNSIANALELRLSCINPSMCFPVDPPSPVDCPVAGRYKFKQIGGHDEKYFTRVEGVTVRPRHHINCREYTSEFRSCNENTKIIQIDVEYCETVDHNGRPIGEYGKIALLYLCTSYDWISHSIETYLFIFHFVLITMKSCTYWGS